MNLKKTLKIVGGSVGGIILILFVILVVHIATAKSVELDNNTLQISRMDFNKPLDSLERKQILSDLKSIPGVKKEHLNMETGVLVYYHDNTIISAKEVWEQMVAKRNYSVAQYVVSAEAASKQVCPVGNSDSFSYKFSRGVQRLFN
ncbi:hypothetical protein QW060_11200 [Myroides ceti]|uniref:Uncharacterized protein n=1 Tax=Paenimyroides ceti TaxID=395087 RepID=A0ABT8CT46_9FLAO|nr:hypothetical protein [Paenimyroides ceti]MDN3707689.1 hypothetical protein [Paenimyroides ceti]